VSGSVGLSGARVPSSPAEAARALEATLLRQLIAASGAFHGSATPGAQIHADMFVEVLADAVAAQDGLGLASMLERSLPPEGQAPPALAPPAAAAPPPAAATSLTPPLRTTGTFGQRVDPIDGTTRFHTGLDLAAPAGTPVTAALPGVVRRAGPRGGYGNAVEIDHGRGLSTLYAHAESLAVGEGDVVTAGQAIATVGQTGRATGPHLHLEVRQDGVPRDPTRALNAYGIRVEDSIGSNRMGARKP
jgi:murein DD-endopeptidase MepM/ murein hydrolase activator NlpD